jgi:hypothetical protein
MLETEIQSLRAEIADLKQAVNTLTATLLGVAHAALPAAPVIPKVVTVSTVEAPAPEALAPTAAPAPAPTPTVDDLQALCSELVRADASIKPKIKELIASFDGAKTLSKVPTDRLPELKAALEALQ